VLLASDLRVAPQPTYDWVPLNAAAEVVTEQREWSCSLSRSRINFQTAEVRKDGMQWMCWSLVFCAAVRPELDLIPVTFHDEVAKSTQRPAPGGIPIDLNRLPLKAGSKYNNAKRTARFSFFLLRCCSVRCLITAYVSCDLVQAFCQDRAGIEITTDHRGCARMSGSFEVLDLRVNEDSGACAVAHVRFKQEDEWSDENTPSQEFVQGEVRVVDAAACTFSGARCSQCY
jgi:hypothetical protein